MNLPNPEAALVHEHIGDILFGTFFLFIGLASCAVGALRYRREFRLLVWFGLFTGLYGTGILAHIADVLGLFPGSPWPDRLIVAVDYLFPVPSLLFWAERTKGLLRRALVIAAGVGLGVAIAGLGWYAITGSHETLQKLSVLLALGAIMALGTLPLFPSLFARYFVVQSVVLRYVLPAIAGLMLIVNAMYFLGHPPARFVEPIGFALWVFATGYEAATYTFDNERRLLSIESELETARNIQSSILPDRPPTIDGLRIAASYNPMSAVAGDFYQFLQVDHHRIGVLIADVTGHGVPAALISSMIKVAMQSAAAVACDPGKVLGQLNRTLTPELNGRLTSAAYLWIDARQRSASYSAAGHPPLLQWRNDNAALLRIESNGLLFGVTAGVEYPVKQISFNSGDRFLLYTDGLTEPENAHGDAYGESRLEALVRENRAVSAEDLIQRLIAALKDWQPSSSVQQDDITLIVIDVL